MKLIIDTDPGVDDALALLYAKLCGAFEIVGLTSVFGNVVTDTATENTLWMAEQLGFNVPVAGGAQQPLGTRPHEPIPIIHGHHGFGTLPKRQPTSKPINIDAADFMIEQTAKSPGEITVVALGPLANVALALERDAAFAQNVREIVIMGGAYKAPGNVNEFAEANIFNDTYAAEIVFQKGIKVRAVGLDVTDQILLSWDSVSDLVKNAGIWAEFLKNCCDYYLKFYASKGVTAGAGLHDPTTLITLVRPELFSFESGTVSVVQSGEAEGQTQFTPSKGNVSFAAKADLDAVLNEFMATLSKLANMNDSDTSKML